MGCVVDGLRSSQLRKLLKSCRNGLILDVERLPTDHLPLSLPPQHGRSEPSAGYHSLPARLPQTSLDEDSSLISNSVPSSSFTPLSSSSSVQYLTSDRHVSTQNRPGEQLHTGVPSGGTHPPFPSPSSPTQTSFSSLSLRQTDV